MKIGFRVATLLMLLLVNIPAVLAESSVWKVSRGENHIFLGGTVHFLAPDDYPLPQAFAQAYSRAQILVLETDIQGLQSPEGLQRMMRRLSYPQGRNLQQVIRKDTYQALEKFFTERSVAMAQIESMKPGLVSMMITIIELQRHGLVGEGVDAYFEKKAIDEQKPRLQLETIDAQIEFLAGMGAGREDELMAYSLEEASRVPQLMLSMKNAWRNGDMDSLARIGIGPMIQDFPKLYHDLLVKRNHDWMSQLQAMLETPQTELVLVGALHLAGKDGLLTGLRARGYMIEQLP